MNTTIGTAQSDREQIVNVSKNGETMTTTEKITKENKSGYAQHTNPTNP